MWKYLGTGEKRALIHCLSKNKLEADLNRRSREHPSDLWIRMRGNGLLSSQTSGSLFFSMNASPHEVGLFLGYPLDDVQDLLNRREKLQVLWDLEGLRR